MCEFYRHKKKHVLSTNISQVIYIIDLSWYMYDVILHSCKTKKSPVIVLQHKQELETVMDRQESSP